MRMVRRRSAAVVLIGALLAFGSGCDVFGDDADPATTAGTATTPPGPGGPDAAAYRQDANASCVKADQQISELDNPSNPSADQIADILEQGLTIQQEHIDELKALEPPAALEARHDRGVSLLEERQSVTEDLLERVRDGDTNSINELGPRIQRLRTQGNAVAQQLGLTECVNAAGAASVTPSDTSGSASTPLGRYRSDVMAAGRAIAQFATLLQSGESFSSKLERLEANLDTFDQNVADLRDYELTNARLERQRAGIVRTGPQVSNVLRRFLQATAANDEGAIRALAPEVREVLSDFQSVVTEGGG
jgi:hypothetical protein